MNIFLKAILAFSLVLGSTARADEGALPAETTKTTLETSAAPSPKNWSAGYSAGQYDYRGVRAADGDLYSFDRILFTSQSVSASYKGPWNLQTSLKTQYWDKYSETRIHDKVIPSQTRGLGDTVLETSYTAPLQSAASLRASLGLSLPTGSIHEKNARNPATDYAYYLQLGSGTFDLLPAVTYMKFWQSFYAGSTGGFVLRLGRNDLGYSLGNEAKGVAFVGYKFASWLNSSLAYTSRRIDALRGDDPTLGRNPYTEYYYEPQDSQDVSVFLKGESRLAKDLGLNYLVGVPLYQRMQNVADLEVAARPYANLSLNYIF